MTHFEYEGSVTVKDGKQILAKAKVMSIEFLTPAKLNLKASGVDFTQLVNVDIINRKVYDASGKEFMSQEVFNHLDSINSLPEDFYSAPEDLQLKASRVEEERTRFEEFK
jgi:hypothetical protein